MAKVLIVDDEFQVVQHVKELLLSFGHAFGFISKSSHLFQRLENDPCDLILLDVNMPEIDGLTLLKQLKAHSTFKNIPVIMLTGDTSDQLVASCFELGATDFINKPIHVSTLQARIESTLGATQAKEELEEMVSGKTVELRDANTQLEDMCSELEYLNKAFQLFVPKPFLHRIQAQESIQIGQFEEEVLSFLFADIRGYTHLAEDMTPEDNLQFLNTFFGLVEPPINKHHGFVDKYIGDSIMGLFDHEESAVDALRAAIEMQNEIKSFNRFRVNKNMAPISFGIGINTGPAMVGLLGSSHRLDSTVIGDHVNLASRLQELTKSFQANILISHHTFNLLPEDTFLMREVDTVKVRGRKKPVLIYDVFESDDPEIKEKKLKTKQLLFQGIVLYKSLFLSDALDRFLKCLEIFPEDGVAVNYVRRCRYFLKFPPPVEDYYWDGIIKDLDSILLHAIMRREIRCLVEIPAIVFFTPSLDFLKASDSDREVKTIDLSTTGAKIRCDHSLQVGIVVRLEIMFENSPFNKLGAGKSMGLLCQVMWSTPKDANDEFSTWEAGLEFLITTPENEKTLDESLHNFAKEFPDLRLSGG